MPIRFPYGAMAYLEDDATTILSGRTAASISFFIRLNSSGSVIGGPAGVRFVGAVQFGWYGTAASASLNWVGRDSSLALKQGTIYHVLGTLSDDGTVRTYRNGILVNQTGGSPLTLGSGYFRLGRFSGDTCPAFDIDELAVWSSTLTQADAISLRDRTVSPADLGGGSLRFYAPLGGAGPVSAANVPVSGGFVAWNRFVGSGPTFLEEPLIFPVDARPAVRLSPSRKGIFVSFTRISDGSPTGASQVVTSPDASLNGAAFSTLPTPNRLVAGGIYFRLPYTVGPGDSLVLSAPANWATTSAGASEALAGPVTNTDVPFFPATPGPKTMKLGYNLEWATYWTVAPIYADLMRTASSDWFNWPSGSGLDSEGWVTNFTGGGGTQPKTILRSKVPGGFGADGTPRYLPTAFPSGTLTLRWTGPAGSYAVITGTGIGAVVESGPGLRRYAYTRPADGSMGSSNELRTSHPGMRVQVYPPGVPDDGSQKFSPYLLQQLGESRVLRFLNPTSTNSSNVITSADFTPRNYRTVGGLLPRFARNFTITRIEPWVDSLGIFDATHTKLLFTTAAPHNLVDGAFVRLPNDPTQLTVTLAGGSFNFSNYSSIAKVLSPTTFALATWSNNRGAMVEAPKTVSVPVDNRPAAHMPYEDIAELCTVVGADCWVCVPQALDDAGVAEMADRLLDNLGTGLRIFAEYSNEHWNSAAGFAQYQYFVMKAVEAGITASHKHGRWYARRAGQVHAIFRARAALRGREDDIVRVMGGFLLNTDVTSAIVDQAYAEGIPIDRLAVATYMNTADGGPGSFYDALDLDQLMDYIELVFRAFGDFPKTSLLPHREILKAKFPGAEMCAYEGGMEKLLPGTAAAHGDTNASNRARALFIHPRMRGITLRYLQNMEEGGAREFAYFTVTGGPADVGSPTLSVQWGAYTGVAQEAGLGDGSDGKFDNRSDYLSIKDHVSVIGQANKEWMAWTSMQIGVVAQASFASSLVTVAFASASAVVPRRGTAAGRVRRKGSASQSVSAAVQRSSHRRA